MILVQSATLYPYKDAITGSEKGPFIDTGIQTTPDFGDQLGKRIYLSLDTVREMAALAGVTHAAADTGEAHTRGYVEGKLDAIQEDLGGNLARIAGDLGVVVAHLRARTGDVVAAEDAEVPAG